MFIDYEQEKKEFHKNQCVKYVYSYVHLQELREAGNKLETLKAKRLASIERLTDGLYCENNDEGILGICNKTPYEVYEVLDSSSIYRICLQMIQQLTNKWRPDINPNFLTDKLGIEKREINNYSSKKILEKYGEPIMRYVKESSRNRQEEFQSLFNILDALGFWQDKVRENTNSTMNRSYDANHAYFASVCDYFITDDKRTKNKANFIYELFSYKTRAISFNEFEQIIASTKK